MPDGTPPPHDHDRVDEADLVEEDPFHDDDGNALYDDELVELTEFGAQCWDAGVDPDELGRLLRGE